MATPKKSISTITNVDVDALRKELKKRGIKKSSFSEQCGYSANWLSVALKECRFSGALQVALREKLNIDIADFTLNEEPEEVVTNGHVDEHLVRNMKDEDLYKLIRDAIKEALGS